MNRKIGKALVVGAGIGGIRAALDLAEYGYGVTLIDRSAHIGGILSQLDHQFPTDRCGMCKMLPLVDRDAGSQYCLRKGLFHENIDILLNTELSSIEGEPGRFQVRLTEHSNWVDPQRCIGCGACTPVCPVEVPDEFNAGMAKRKAIYLPVPHSVPNPYIIDVTACNRCGACLEVCPTKAVHLPEEKREGFRILVVDDELVIRDSLKEWLEEEGFAVDMAASGSEALARLEKQAYQLMLLDIKMPGMDGVEVLQKACESFADLKVIMMTAYATVETAVEAMKTGALDYLIKPFDPADLIPMVQGIYRDQTVSEGRELEVGAVVLCGGTAFFDPAGGKDAFGYSIYPNVVTNLEFERLLSGTGPFEGKLLRPPDGKPLNKIAWIQCVGSRDLQTEADFCSSICCMAAIKEAVLVREKAGRDLETTIFYMDMRTFGKGYQRYRDQAETLHGVRFERGRVHSVIRDTSNGDMLIRWVDIAGGSHESRFDLLVLTVGQRPAEGTAELAEKLALDLNPWGFIDPQPFSLTRTSRNGILVGGAGAGLKDISDAVIQASAAASAASRVIHGSGGSLALEPVPHTAASGVDREAPRILVALCTCGGRIYEVDDPPRIVQELQADPAVTQVEFLEQICTAEGWGQLVKLAAAGRSNRLLIGACLPYVNKPKLDEFARETGLDPALIEVVDTIAACGMRHAALIDRDSKTADLVAALQTGIAKLKWVKTEPVSAIPIVQRALVVGGGIAGMTAALAIADHGFRVDLVEQTGQLGGNLNWLQHSLEGHSVKTLLEDTCLLVERHPKIDVHLQSRVVRAGGEVGHFSTTVQGPQQAVRTIDHGVTILATGGTEAPTASYGYGSDPSIITQKELEQKLADQTIDPAAMSSVVMIQCVDAREEPRNYCSRVCCPHALKNALDFKKINPQLAVYILYRDMMAYGFAETFYTQARRAGVIFIQYRVDNKPQVESGAQGLAVDVSEPIVGRRLHIPADLVVLATGVVPRLPSELAQAFGAALDRDGFFREAESKWRPVDSIKEGIFACGLALSPHSIAESIATAEAAAARALRILTRERLPAGKVVAAVRRSLCSLCAQCIDACPYGARTLDPDHEAVVINPAMCQGCGACAVACPNGASVLEGFCGQQMFEAIDAAAG